MKTFTLCLSFVKRYALSICITCLTLASGIFLLVAMVGMYQFQKYTLEVYKASDLQDAVFVMPSFFEDGTELRERSQMIQETASQMDGVSHILNYQSSIAGYGDHVTNAMYWSKEMRDNFKLQLVEGEWFSEDPTETEAVIGGAVWDGVSVGDTVTLSNGVTAKVVGIMGEHVVYPAFSSGTNDAFPASKLFNTIDTMVFLTEETIDFASLNIKNMSGNKTMFFVCFADDATQAEKDAVLLYLESEGVVRTYEDIVQDSEDALASIVTEQFPLPLFLLCITTIGILCICAVIVKRSMPDMAKYYLLGCTKARYTGILAGTMACVFSIPALLGIAAVVLSPDVVHQIFHAKYIIDAHCVLPIILYVCLLVGILILMPMLFYRKYSPVDLYRRNL
ncbi:MAG: ABC transporter permease [Clostridia bacterium]|nr:ABC transporter permease [Clostridia bacterium]